MAVWRCTAGKDDVWRSSFDGGSGTHSRRNDLGAVFASASAADQADKTETSIARRKQYKPRPSRQIEMGHRSVDAGRPAWPGRLAGGVAKGRSILSRWAFYNIAGFVSGGRA